MEDTQGWKHFVQRENETAIAAEALLLKLKSSGKELDPKHFDEAEQKIFRQMRKSGNPG